MLLGPTEIELILETFGLSRSGLAKALGVAPYTITRWMVGDNPTKPTGLQEEVLKGLYNTAVEVRRLVREEFLIAVEAIAVQR